MIAQTSSEPKARSISDLVKIVESMQIGETKMIRVDIPQGMVPDCDRLVFDLSKENEYNVSIVQ